MCMWFCIFDLIIFETVTALLEFPYEKLVSPTPSGGGRWCDGAG